MYPTASGGCTTVVHLLMRWPILVIILGLSGASGYVNSVYHQDDSPEQIIGATVQNMQERSDVQRIVAEAQSLVAKGSAPTVQEEGFYRPEGVFGVLFVAIQKAEGGPNVVGVHPDGISYGPAGLTERALRDVLRDVPSCADLGLGYENILNDPELSTQFAYLYFLDLIHRFGNVETAIIAYNYGLDRTGDALHEGNALPRGYLQEVIGNL